ncbi:MAG: hypothetical protein IPP93_15145 [Chitinophagaceae bacterium]|nr:hypothetical protein [Chitinophagaceae bacterium]
MLRLIYIFPVLLLCSCSTVLKYPQSGTQPIRPGLTATFSNKPFKTEDKAYQIPPEYSKRNLLNHFDSVTSKVQADTVRLEFSNNGKLTIFYHDGQEAKSASYNGTFSKKGYFDIIFKLKVVKIPPLLPILYSHVERDRIRFYLTKENDLLICRQWVSGGNIFILSGGDSDKTKNFFHRAGQ